VSTIPYGPPAIFNLHEQVKRSIRGEIPWASSAQQVWWHVGATAIDDEAHAAFVAVATSVSQGRRSISWQIWRLGLTNDRWSLVTESPERVEAIAVDGNGDIVVTAGHHVVRVWDVRTGVCIRRFKTRYVDDIAISRNGSEIAAHEWCHLKVWHLDD